MNKMGIPFIGSHYIRTEKDHASFDPMIANIQLYWLMQHTNFSDLQAYEYYKQCNFETIDSEIFFQTLIKEWQSYKKLYPNWKKN